MNKSLLIAAGGTGGHLFPAAAFSEEMRARGWRVTLMTDARGRRYAERFPADAIEDVPAATVQGMNPVRLAAAGVTIVRGVAAARARLAALAPRLVAGFGGYPSLPALAAARLARTPILIHEQNAVLGRVNRAFAPAAQAVACGFPRLEKLPPAALGKREVVGNPVRAPILAIRGQDYPLLPAGAPVRVLIIGGSQGAKVLGDVVPAALARLPADLRARLDVTQQAREEQAPAVREVYARAAIRAEVSPFFSDMAQRYAACHLVIARAGASTVTEIAAVGRPAIFIPLAIATDDHQAANAAALVDVGAADMIREAALTVEGLAALLAERLLDAHGLAVRAAAAKAVGKADAAQRLADLAERIAA